MNHCRTLKSKMDRMESAYLRAFKVVDILPTLKDGEDVNDVPL